MKPFETHTGIVATLDRSNVDTDQIIPKQFLKRIERTGFGQFLFYDWRFLEDGSPNPDFELNQPQFQGASILVGRKNFGNGSSREHAVWSLDDYGIRAVIAESFADIFYNNCFKNGLLPITLTPEEVHQIHDRVNQQDGYQLTIDLPAQSVRDEDGLEATFEIETFRKECLIGGLDQIALTLNHIDKIEQFEKANGYCQDS
ncbi:MAG: 3-isopropylmalate dehydratase small subunit [Mariniblastus sp.]|nr:3-isopropylmalate dehydratase small subunit [Mariniblastus sp.]